MLIEKNRNKTTQKNIYSKRGPTSFPTRNFLGKSKYSIGVEASSKAFA